METYSGAYVAACIENVLKAGLHKFSKNLVANSELYAPQG
jgi:hypothetical protein